VTPDDPGDADTGPNNLQNFPQISYAAASKDHIKVAYTVPSDPNNSTYPIRVEFFKRGGGGQGQTYLGFDIFTADDFKAGVDKLATVPVAVAVKYKDRIIATATDSLPTGEWANTSEFSPNTTILAPPLRNPRNRLDVNDDTHVAANDVVGVINYLNAFGPGVVPDDAVSAAPYIDVNGDNNISPSDALDVINAINAGQGGEGDVGTDSSALQSAADNVFALLAYDQFAQSQRKRS
jgi:hypothetical protein